MHYKTTTSFPDFIWINGKIVPYDKSYIHITTHSLHYSGAVFEGERAYSGKVFKLLEHTNRLLKSAELMHLDVNYSVEEITNATYELLKANNLQNAYIRPLIWRGSESIGIYDSKLTTHTMIFAQESKPSFKQGLKICISPWRKPLPDALPVQAKSSAHYGMMIISQKIARDSGYDDALLLDQYDEIAECSATNIFFGRNKELVTPIADRFLNGITRQTVIEIARDLDMRVEEKRLTLEDIESYDTCFATGTASEIRGIAQIDHDNKHLYFPNNSLVKLLQQKYAQIVGKT